MAAVPVRQRGHQPLRDANKSPHQSGRGDLNSSATTAPQQPLLLCYESMTGILSVASQVLFQVLGIFRFINPLPKGFVMSPQAGWILQEEVVPRLRSAILGTAAGGWFHGRLHRGERRGAGVDAEKPGGVCAVAASPR